MGKQKRPSDESSFDSAFARLREGVERIYAQRPSPEPTDKPLPEVAETAAERELFRAEIAHRLRSALGCEPEACADHRCRRTRRCREIQESEAFLEQMRARVERERGAAQGSTEDRENA